MAIRPKVMLVDEDRELVDLMSYSLRRAGLDVVAVVESAAVFRCFEEWQPDIVLLETMIDGSAGFDVLTGLRRRSEVPIIIVTALQSEDETVRGFQAGADDYVTKPFSHSELLARMDVQLRLAGLSWSPPRYLPEYMHAGPLTLNTTEHALLVSGRKVSLTPMEVRLLAYLMARPNATVPTKAILRWLWGGDESTSKTTLQVLVHRLRRKLDADPEQPRVLETVPGVGLRLVSATEPNAH